MHEGFLEQILDRVHIARRAQSAADQGRQGPFVAAHQHDKGGLIATTNPFGQEFVGRVVRQFDPLQTH